MRKGSVKSMQFLERNFKLTLRAYSNHNIISYNKFLIYYSFNYLTILHLICFIFLIWTMGNHKFIVFF